MGKREFVGSRAKRIAMKVNPLTQCVTDEECLLEIEESGEFFEEPPLDRAGGDAVLSRCLFAPDAAP